MPFSSAVVAVRRAVGPGDGDERAAAGGALERDLLGVDRRDDVGGIGQRDRRDVDEAQELDAQIADEQDDHDDDEQRRRRSPGETVKRRPPGSASGIGGGATATRRRCAQLLHLLAPAIEDLVWLEAEVDRVVAQEALGVDRRRQLVPVAVLERRQVAQADLGVALGAIQVDALALARELERLADGRRRGRVDRRSDRDRAAFRDAVGGGRSSVGLLESRRARHGGPIASPLIDGLGVLGTAQPVVGSVDCRGAPGLRGSCGPTMPCCSSSSISRWRG